MEITIKIDANTNKVSISSANKGADCDIDRPSKSILYAVITQGDVHSYLEGIFDSLEEAKKCRKKAYIQNEQFFGDNASTTIWRQYPGEKCMPMKDYC